MLSRMNSTRRDLCLSLPALAFFAEMSGVAQQAAPAAATESKPDPAKIAAGTKIFSDNHIFNARELPIHSGKTGSSQAVCQGVLPTGEGVEMHNTVLLPGMAPHPPHQHMHSEWLFLREGKVEWLIDGKWEPAEAGDILYASSMKLHGLKNVGTTPAKYFVMAVGPNLKG
jgi:quercetin dioxygenase-like cupin family protein